jgi:hypothetical protein
MHKMEFNFLGDKGRNRKAKVFLKKKRINCPLQSKKSVDLISI